MPVHKRVAKALVKQLPKAAVAGLPPAAYYPYVALGVTLGNLVTNLTRPYWEEPVKQSGREMGQEVRKMFDAIALPLTFESIDPASPWNIPPGYGAPGMPRRASPTAPTKTKRKISKANKAMKMAYDFYRKKHKGKMTQKKCRMLMRKASKMAGKANPHTKSRIGKGGDWIKRHCRKVRKGVWNTSRRSYGKN